MRFKIARLKLLPVFAALSTMGWASSCNNSDESGNNSTSASPDSLVNTDTTGIAHTDNTMVAGDTMTTKRMSSGKKKGKISIAMSEARKTDKMAADNMGYYNYAEVSPVYNGGQSALQNYISNNIEYPQDAIDNNAEGTVYVQFGVDENGKISNVKTTGNKIGYGLEEQAVKVISGMSKWNPGTVKGKKVKTSMVLPVTYKLEG